MRLTAFFVLLATLDAVLFAQTVSVSSDLVQIVSILCGLISTLFTGYVAYRIGTAEKKLVTTEQKVDSVHALVDGTNSAMREEIAGLRAEVKTSHELISAAGGRRVLEIEAENKVDHAKKDAKSAPAPKKDK